MPTPKFPELEEKMLAVWEAEHLFEKTREKNKNGKPFVFFEGPPTANGKPGVHHMLPRSFKDVVPRFESMRGRRVDRKGGWDTHGLPVELLVEKQLGISGKPQIENLVPGDPRASIIQFNEKCKASVWEFLDDWIKMSHRMGYWVDTDNAYVTYKNEYIESLWSVLKEVNRRGFLYQGYKVVPHCPRCGTGLSSHEVAQGYKTVVDESVFVKFQVVGEANTFFLGWTTTPWTLPGNVALAVKPDGDYISWEILDVATNATERIIVLKELSDKVFGAPLIEEGGTMVAHGPAGEPGKVYTDVGHFKGSDLVGKEYTPLFPYLADQMSPELRAVSYKVYAADFVTTTDGT
ncbi:MAG: class I tRNA ligase family protein [Candidatus Magasanikbacteria bacterium]|nr:class I tRNA ligase family protein [Candidatus Magasanikbacteria bacterium]